MDLNPYYIVLTVIAIAGSVLLAVALLVKDMLGLLWYGIGTIVFAFIGGIVILCVENDMNRFSNWIYPVAFFAILCLASAGIMRCKHNS